MKTPALFREYIWLVNTIAKNRKISLIDINKKWLRTEMSEGIDISRNTFIRHKRAIEEIFGIIIECDTKDSYQYYIANEHVLHEDTVQNWMVSTLSVNEIISDSKTLRERIVLQSIPHDEYLETIIEAMKKNVRVSMKYLKYGYEEASDVTIEPYCLKLFAQRWYVLAHFHRNASADKEERDWYVVYALDRVKEMTLTDERFELDKEFDAQEFFKECYGVIAGDGTPAEKIILRANGRMRYYLKDLPLHNSQKLIREGTNYADYEYYLRPTADFNGDVLSWGNQLQVLEPQSLADEIAKMALETYCLYHPNAKISPEI